MSEIRTITAGELRKPRYQRDEAPSFISRWTKNYDPRLVGTVVVSERDEGLYYVIDGWHRRQIVMELFGGKHLLRCEVHQGLSEQEEANMFDALDTQRQKLTSRDHFAGRLRMGGLVEKDIMRILTSYGVGLVLNRSGGATPNQTGAHQTLYELYGANGTWGSPDLLERVMRVATGAYGVHGATYGTLLKATGILLRTRPEISDKSLVEKLAQFGTHHQLMGSVKGLPTGGGGAPMKLANQMLTIYNHRRSTHRMPEIVAGDLRKAREARDRAGK